MSRKVFSIRKRITINFIINTKRKRQGNFARCSGKLSKPHTFKKFLLEVLTSRVNMNKIAAIFKVIFEFFLSNLV